MAKTSKRSTDDILTEIRDNYEVSANLMAELEEAIESEKAEAWQVGSDHEYHYWASQNGS